MKDAMKSIKKQTEEWWLDLPMSDRYQFAYDKTLDESSDFLKNCITGESPDSADDRRREEFAHQVALMAENDTLKWN